jgi:hypothetical protein
MKCAIVIAHKLKQIMLYPENDEERQALRMITPDYDISVDVQEGSFFEPEPPPSALGYVVKPCQAGYMRAWRKDEGVMLVLRPKDKKQGANSCIKNQIP